jgi:hypothetical protein
VRQTESASHSKAHDSVWGSRAGYVVILRSNLSELFRLVRSAFRGSYGKRLWELDLSRCICYVCLMISREGVAGRPALGSGPMSQSEGSGGGGSSSGGGWRPGHPEPSPRSPTGQAFAGWIALSDFVSSSNLKLSDAMRALASSLQAAIDHSAAQKFAEIRSLLRQGHVSSSSVFEIERFFFSDRSTHTTGEMAQLAHQYLSELIRSGVVSRSKGLDRSFPAAVMKNALPAILGGATPRAIEGFPVHFMPATPFRVVASLEPRKLASGGNFSIFCRRPLRRRGDRLVAAEHTYIERDIYGLSNPRVRGGLVTQGYRDDIDSFMPLDFIESINEGSPVDQYYYSYEITGQRRSRAERKMRAALESNSSAFRSILKSVMEAGVALGTAAATRHGVPVEVVQPLAGSFTRIAEDGVRAILLRGISLTPWSITHTTLNMGEFPDGPLSMFSLISPADPAAKLHQVVRNPLNPDVCVMNIEYQDKIRANQRGRGMFGVSKLPDNPCPSDLWDHVAQKNQPAVWTEPGQDQGGFRVLVPHAEIDGKASYVSALRADVFRIPENRRS